MSPPDKLYKSKQLADLLEVSVSSIIKWIHEGRLAAYRTPGGHRRIRASDALAFLRAHGMFVPPELGTRRKVLFVDDDGHMLAGMRRAMRAYASQVELVTAQSGIEALVALGADRPDMIVVDYGMSDLNGLELLVQLKQRAETRSIDVVLLSGAVSAELEKKARALGARDVREKPLSAEDLVELASGRPAGATG